MPIFIRSVDQLFATMQIYHGPEGARPKGSKRMQEKSKGYESSKFNPKWLIDENGGQRSWLKFDEADDLMYCCECRKFASNDVHKTGPFWAQIISRRKASST